MFTAALLLYLVPLAVVIGLSVILGLWVVALRRVVPVNEVHIVQTRKTTTSYGKGFPSNTYYEWPSWLPAIGLTKITLPVSNFSIDLPDYAAYDKERVPFLVHIMAFFRISDSNTAAQRVSSFAELKGQLTSIVQGAVRTVLAGHEIDQIMLERSKFGEAFTAEVAPQLANWGIESIKNIELMDIRDAKESEVIHNIMAKRTSGIERESRLVVADNTRQAEMAEIAAKREIEMSRQLAAEQVGLRTAQKDQAVGVANEQASQQVKVQQRETATKEMDVVQVTKVRSAEIAKQVAVVGAQQAKEVQIVDAEANKQVAVVEAEGNKVQTVLTAEGHKAQTVLVAEGKLEAARRNAEGVTLEGAAKGSAETAILMAPVNAQMTLAKEIGGNLPYQEYLLRQRTIEANQAVALQQVTANQAIGVAQAGALENADIKIVTTAGAPTEGMKSVMDLFTPAGAQQLVSTFETLVNAPTVKKAVEGEKADA